VKRKGQKRKRKGGKERQTGRVKENPWHRVEGTCLTRDPLIAISLPSITIIETYISRGLEREMERLEGGIPESLPTQGEQLFGRLWNHKGFSKPSPFSPFMGGKRTRVDTLM
jgi:hypothetical protein